MCEKNAESFLFTERCRNGEFWASKDDAPESRNGSECNGIFKLEYEKKVRNLCFRHLKWRQKVHSTAIRSRIVPYPSDRLDIYCWTPRCNTWDRRMNGKVTFSEGYTYSFHQLRGRSLLCQRGSRLGWIGDGTGVYICSPEVVHISPPKRKRSGIMDYGKVSF